MSGAKPTIEVKNRRAGFEYHLLDSFECGIVLTGTEIKSIRAHGASISEAYCTFIGVELFVCNMQINPWMQTVHFTHEPKRDRKLLLKHRELEKLKRKLKDAGMTIIPTRLLRLTVFLIIVFALTLTLLLEVAELRIIEDHVLLWSMGAIALANVIGLVARKAANESAEVIGLVYGNGLMRPYLISK
jgi:SsrA-binding protein